MFKIFLCCFYVFCYQKTDAANDWNVEKRSVSIALNGREAWPIDSDSEQEQAENPIFPEFELSSQPLPLHSSSRYCATVAPTTITEEQRNHNLYIRFKSLIENKNVSDEILFRLLLNSCLKSNIDALHSNGQDSIAVLLIKVTRPYDFQYAARGIIMDSPQDKYKNCFRHLGHKLFPNQARDPFRFDLDQFYDSTKIYFKGSALEKEFMDIILHSTKDRDIAKETAAPCCVVQ